MPQLEVITEIKEREFQSTCEALEELKIGEEEGEFEDNTRQAVTI